MAERQLDLFADPVSVEPSVRCVEPSVRAAELTDAALIAVLPGAGVATSPSLAAEAARRHLGEAVPALERLCQRLTGFGGDRLVPEQTAALEALAAIGGEAAQQAVTRLVAHRVVQGPTLGIALNAAARLRARLPSPRLEALLRDGDPSVRAGACRCVRSAGPHLRLLIELIDDLHPEVAASAAIALGRIGRAEARPLLLGLLHRQPSPEVVEALAVIADEAVIVALGRIARARPGLAQPVLDALDQLADPRARRVAAALRARHSTASGDGANN